MYTTIPDALLMLVLSIVFTIVCCSPGVILKNPAYVIGVLAGHVLAIIKTGMEPGRYWLDGLILMVGAVVGALIALMLTRRRTRKCRMADTFCCRQTDFRKTQTCLKNGDPVQCFNHDESVHTIAPVRKARPLLDKSVAALTVVLLKAMSLLDPIFKWGEKTCPQCLSKKLMPFTVENSDERPMHYCNGCNTIWPARSHSVRQRV